MPRISLTDFIDIVAKSGTPKATKVTQVKERPDYHPSHDFYKPLREELAQCHQKDKPKETLKEVISTVHPKKRAHYQEAIEGYNKWWGTQTFEWVDPPRADFTEKDTSIIVNPELGLSIKGVPHAVKLYFKDEKLDRWRVELATHLMAVTLGKRAEGLTFGVLDVRRGKLYTASKPNPSLTKMVKAEIAYISEMWGTE